MEERRYHKNTTSIIIKSSDDGLSLQKLFKLISMFQDTKKDAKAYLFEGNYYKIEYELSDNIYYTVTQVYLQ